MGTIFLLAGLVVGVLRGYGSAANAAGTPSPTKDLAVPSDASKVFKVHSWNVLNIDKIDNGNGRYSVRTVVGTTPDFFTRYQYRRHSALQFAQGQQFEGIFDVVPQGRGGRETTLQAG